jgi:hypothetical protein
MTAAAIFDRAVWKRLCLFDRTEPISSFLHHDKVSFKMVRTAADFRTGLRRPAMLELKDTLRATVRMSFDGRVFKTFHGPGAGERFANEVRVLRHLETRGCGFVPKLLDADPRRLQIITTSCGNRVEHLDDERARELFAELERYGVRHDDPEVRNVTYRMSDGRFCVVDFELATILPGCG